MKFSFDSEQPRRSAIGIDVGSRHINAIQMDGTGSPRRIAAAISLPRSQPGAALTLEETRKLPAALKRAGLSGNKIVLAAPLEKQFGGVFEMPTADVSAHERMTRLELARIHRCPPAHFEMGCWELPKHGAGESQGKQMMAIACRHEDAAPFLDLFENAGFEVQTLDLRAAALARAAAPLTPAEGGIVAILELNWKAASLVLVHQNELIFERLLADCELQRVYDVLVQRLQLDAELADYLLLETGLDAMNGDAPVSRQARTILSAYFDGLLAELSASMTYATERYADVPVDSLLLCGDGAAIPGIDRRIGDAVKIEARKMTPVDLCAGQKEFPAPAASAGLVTAMGLAL